MTICGCGVGVSCTLHNNARITLHSLVGVSGGERLAIDIDHGLLSEILNHTHSTERERTTCVLYRHT